MPTLAEIEREWNTRIEMAPDDTTRTQYELQKANAVTDFYRQDAAQQAIERTRAQLLNEFPDADPDAVTGSTPEEMRTKAEASDKRFKERTSAATAAAAEAAKAAAGNAAYGATQPRGGQEPGAGAPAAVSTQRAQTIEDAWEGLRNGTLTRAQSEQLVKNRTAMAIEAGIKRGINAQGGPAVAEGEE